MTVPVHAVLTSAFPRSEELVRATRDLDRGRIPPAAGAAAFDRAEADVRALESHLALDGITGGCLRWQDLFRPFSELWTGVSVGTLTRFFETNTFFRQPILSTPPQPGRGSLADWLPRLPRGRAILPGPFTFAALAEVRFDPPEGDVIGAIARAFAGELSRWSPDAPVQIQFQEPLLVYRPPAPGEWAAITAAYRTIAAAAAGRSIAVWTYFGDAAPVLADLARLPVDVVGFDLFETDVARAGRLAPRGIGVGCLDPRTTSVEDVKSVGELVRGAVRAFAPTSVWLGPNPPYDLLPYGAARAKAEMLPLLRREVA